MISLSFFDIIRDQAMNNGNFSFAILMVGILGIVATLTVGIIQIVLMSRNNKNKDDMKDK